MSPEEILQHKNRLSLLNYRFAKVNVILRVRVNKKDKALSFLSRLREEIIKEELSKDEYGLYIHDENYQRHRAVKESIDFWKIISHV